MTEHRVSLFYDLTFTGRDAPDRLALVSLAQAADPDWVHPARLAADAARPIARATLWDWAAWSLSPDFHAYVHGVLDSSPAEPGEQPMCLSRSPVTKALLEGRYRAAPGVAGPKTGLVLVLGGSRRVQEIGSRGPVLHDGGEAGLAVEVEIESVTAHLFRTGVGLVIPRLRLKPRERGADVPPELLVEIVPRLGDERRRPAFGWLDDWSAKGAPRFGLSTLMRRLVAPAGCRLVPRERTYTYVTVVADRPVEAERDLAFRLSRHYSAAYRATEDFLGTTFVRPFETVLHAASREGGCTLVTPGTGPQLEFLQTWLEQADASAYFPLQVAAVHEYYALLGMAQGAGLAIDPEADDPRAIALLKDLRHRFLLFRLRYRLLQVSTITAHELAFNATVHALGIEALSTKMSRDLVEVERRLIELAGERAKALQAIRAARERRRERKVAWITGFASAALAYITMASLGDHVVELTSVLKGGGTWNVLVFANAAGFALAIWSLYYAVRWKQGDEHFAAHVHEHEQIEMSLARRPVSHGETRADLPDGRPSGGPQVHPVA